ncbi:hypothetical protein ACFPZ0_17790 [Streptomonospora nanhaiensis]|uniref:Uncharacterized protein n=1 Tax=Streptomonospora nanhaiensis TaxID=1323731 RepID=A0A853BTH4_9ACTN|nr:hypothetical protein [Streptomonospora nanhaiensis]MBV2363812.1 hypothetical protein [Streptomonospora nanhaiensis]MBX9388794.1 hypothetical protein [Streptomonospora nanhaiensis]NYI97602.1 hypothetical protein [Streptomonospora nanhaiensis]
MLSLESLPFDPVYFILALATAAVGVLALVGAGRAPHLRALIRTAGALLVLRALVDVTWYVWMLNFTPDGSGLGPLMAATSLHSVLSTLLTIASVVLLLIAIIAGARRGRPSGAPPESRWNPPGGAPGPSWHSGGGAGPAGGPGA